MKPSGLLKGALGSQIGQQSWGLVTKRQRLLAKDSLTWAEILESHTKADGVKHPWEETDGSCNLEPSPNHKPAGIWLNESLC